MRNTECPHCSVANYCRQQPWCPRHLRETQHDDLELTKAKLCNCADELQECRELMRNWWHLSARLFNVCKQAEGAILDKLDATGFEQDDPLMLILEKLRELIEEAQPLLTSSSS